MTLLDTLTLGRTGRAQDTETKAGVSGPRARPPSRTMPAV